jgi:hypothetical protein
MLSPVPPLSPAVAEVVAAYPAPVVCAARCQGDYLSRGCHASSNKWGGGSPAMGPAAYLGYQPEVGSMIYLNRGREAIKEGRQG